MTKYHYPLAFYKYSGCGNDFIIIDDRMGHTPPSFAEEVPRLCNRHEGIGADGIILVQKGRQTADVSMKLYNRDGSLAEQCGNGLRCLVRCLHDDLGLEQTHYSIATDAGICLARLCDNEVEIQLGDATPLQGPFRLEECPTLPAYSLKIGVPHLVLLCQELDAIDVATLGRTLRFSPMFKPDGTNVNFAKHLGHNEIAVRTYERGVEDETLACGTGAAAAAVALATVFNLSGTVKVQVRSGATLRYHFNMEKSYAKSITMRGDARRCFQGLYRLPMSPIKIKEAETLREAPYALFS